MPNLFSIFIRIHNLKGKRLRKNRARGGHLGQRLAPNDLGEVGETSPQVASSREGVNSTKPELNHVRSHEFLNAGAIASGLHFFFELPRHPTPETCTPEGQTPLVPHVSDTEAITGLPLPLLRQLCHAVRPPLPMDGSPTLI